jgi:cytochrome c oxidase subunit 2
MMLSGRSDSRPSGEATRWEDAAAANAISLGIILPAIRIVCLVAIVSSLSACSGWQSSLDPQGPHAQHIADLFWAFLVVCTIVWLAVCVVLVAGATRRRGARPDPLDLAPARERMLGGVVLSLAAGTGVVVIAFTLLSYFAQRDLWAAPSSAMTLRVAGHQWWWEVLYEDQEPARSFLAANEIHIPVNTPVRVLLETRDVIHSFWVPTLAGKTDQISGHMNEQQLLAARPGVYRGQCAEFCGREHAKMALLVVATPPEQFNAWRDAQNRPAEVPTDAVRREGLRVFEMRDCMLCHTIRGTSAGGRLGPDLTHLAGRRTIAAGTAPLTAGHLAAWIADPQHIKPGTQMPPSALSGAELSAVVAYLMGLK